jgi:hypothetical protein
MGPSVKERTTGSNRLLSKFSTRLSKWLSPPPICPWRMVSSILILFVLIGAKILIILKGRYCAGLIINKKLRVEAEFVYLR